MSPSKYEEGAENENAPTPFHRMSVLDKAGESYWLKNVRTVGGILYIGADVLAHDGRWVLIQEQDGGKGKIWLNADLVVSFELVEE